MLLLGTIVPGTISASPVILTYLAYFVKTWAVLLPSIFFDSRIIMSFPKKGNIVKKPSAEKAWQAVIKHCRWVGVPISYSGSSVAILNGKKIQVLASTNIITDWQKSFKGAWKVAIYFKKSDKITWQRVSTLLHEMGHIFDYRENMIINNRGIIQTERIANKYAMKIAKVLELPIEKIKPHLDKIVQEYTAVLGKKKTAKMELLWRAFNGKNSKPIRAGRPI